MQLSWKDSSKRHFRFISFLPLLNCLLLLKFRRSDLVNLLYLTYISCVSIRKCFKCFKCFPSCSLSMLVLTVLQNLLTTYILPLLRPNCLRLSIYPYALKSQHARASQYMNSLVLSTGTFSTFYVIIYSCFYLNSFNRGASRRLSKQFELSWNSRFLS